MAKITAEQREELIVVQKEFIIAQAKYNAAMGKMVTMVEGLTGQKGFSSFGIEGKDRDELVVKYKEPFALRVSKAMKRKK